ncbi:MAG: hypothetical protein ACRDVK_08210 [Acidimicrobiia bacterium]
MDRRTDLRSILLVGQMVGPMVGPMVGSGPIIIGQAGEFDYAMDLVRA